MNAQTVMDNQNKYRFGVLIGNENEERFGFDSIQRSTNEQTGISEMKDRYALQNTVYGFSTLTDYQKNPWKDPPISKQTQGKFGLDNELKETNYEETMKRGEAEFRGSFGDDEKYLEILLKQKSEEEKKNMVKFNHSGEQAHIFFGHGIKKNDFENRDFKTTNELAYNLKIKPTDFFHSKFKPDQTAKVLTFTRDPVYESNHLKTITYVGEKNNDHKKFKHYDEFTKKFDLSYNPLKLRNLN